MLLHIRYDCVLLVDTYDTLKSGVPNAIKVANEVLAPLGKKVKRHPLRQW